MTKEELEKEAEEIYIKTDKEFMDCQDEGEIFNLGYLASAEPREKQIEIDAEQIRALQKQNGELTDELTKKSDTNHQLIEQMALLNERCSELKAQIEKMKKYIKACWVEENLNDYSSYITNNSDEFRDLVKKLNEEIRNGR